MPFDGAGGTQNITPKDEQRSNICGWPYTICSLDCILCCSYNIVNKFSFMAHKVYVILNSTDHYKDHNVKKPDFRRF